METVEKCPKHCLIKKNGRCSMCEQEKMEKVAIKYNTFSLYDTSKAESITKTGSDSINNLVEKLSDKFKVIRTKA